MPFRDGEHSAALTAASNWNPIFSSLDDILYPNYR